MAIWFDKLIYGSLCGYMLIYDGCMRVYRILYCGISCNTLIYDGYIRCMRGTWESLGVYDNI